MSNKGYNKEEKSFKAQAAFIEEAPIEEAPIAEEVKEDIEEIPEIRQEFKPTPQVKSGLKQQAKVILITRDGCIGEVVGQPGNNRSFYGADYLTKNLGDIVEF